MRDPFTDPQPGDVVELRPGWGRTVIKRTPRKVWFNVQYGSYWLPNQTSGIVTSSIVQWRRYYDATTSLVVRRGGVA